MMKPCGFQVLIMSLVILFFFFLFFSFFFFLELISIHNTIDLEYEKDGYLLRKMADYMKKKFEKYWGNFDNMNHLLYVGLVLDPRYKLQYLEYCFGALYENQKTTDMAKRIRLFW